jgi:hypothetical protein
MSQWQQILRNQANQEGDNQEWQVNPAHAEWEEYLITCEETRVLCLNERVNTRQRQPLLRDGVLVRWRTICIN